MINLSENDREIIKHMGYPKKLDLSVGSFYVKLVGPERGLKELLGAEIATQMGLITPICEVVVVDGMEYLLSEDLNKYGHFINAEEMDIGDLVEEYCSLNEAKDVLEKEYGMTCEISNLLRIYIFDIIFMHFDRNKRNWGVILLPDNHPKLVILDNEYLLVENDKPEKIKLYFAPIFPTSLYEDFACFLKLGHPDDIATFEYYFNLYTPAFIENLINRLIKKVNLNVEDKVEIIEFYTKHYCKLQDILIKEYKEKHSRS